MPITITCDAAGTWIIPLKVTPKSAKDSFGTVDGDTIPVKVTAAPDKGQANEAVVRFLAKALGLPKSAMTIISGEQSRHKRLGIDWSRTSLPMPASAIDWLSEKTGIPVKQFQLAATA